MVRSVGDLARQADAFLEGEKIVELDPDLIEASFVADRMGDDHEQYTELLQAIREHGQNSPILVRPHPEHSGRYMVVFGHRRLRVAKDLNQRVRAVVKAIDDRLHVLAQGQENAARANLSFIEKAVFAKRLEDLEYGRDVIGAALAANESAVSKMLTVARRVPEFVLNSIGPAPSIGRERWVELSLLIGKKLAVAREVIADPAFSGLSSSARFEQLFAKLNMTSKPVRKTVPGAQSSSWASSDKSISVTVKAKGRGVSLNLAETEARPFGEWITKNLDSLYEAYRNSKKEQ